MSLSLSIYSITYRLIWVVRRNRRNAWSAIGTSRAEGSFPSAVYRPLFLHLSTSYSVSSLISSKNSRKRLSLDLLCITCPLWASGC